MTLNKKILTILILLVIMRMAMSIALIYGFPEKGSYLGGYFYLNDEEEYFRLAFSLARFSPVDSYRTLGFPILLLPFIWLSQANSFDQLLLPVAIFHACVLAPASIILVALIAKRLTKEWKIALLAASIWTIFPYLVYIFVHSNPSFCKDVPAMRMAHQMWLQALTDPPATFFILLAIYTFLISLDKKNVIYPLLTGISFGWATLIRPGNVIMAVLFLSFYLYERKLKHLILFVSSSFFILLPQFIYNWLFYGSPLKFSSLFATDKIYAIELGNLFGRTIDMFSIRNFFFSLQQLILKLPSVILLCTLFIFFVIIYTIFRLYRVSPKAALVLILWVIPYLLVYGSYINFYDSVLHFSMPIIPAILIVISIGTSRITSIIFKKKG